MSNKDNLKKLAPKDKAKKRILTSAIISTVLIGASLLLHTTLGQGILATEWFNASLFTLALSSVGVVISTITGVATSTKLRQKLRSLPNDHYKLAELSKDPEKNAKKITKLLSKIASKELYVANKGKQTPQTFIAKDELGKTKVKVRAFENAEQFSNLSTRKMRKFEKNISAQKMEISNLERKNQNRHIEKLNIAGYEREDNVITSITAQGEKEAKEFLNSENNRNEMLSKKNKRKYGTKVTIKAGGVPEVYGITNAPKLVNKIEGLKLKEIRDIGKRGEITIKYPIKCEMSKKGKVISTRQISNEKELENLISSLDNKNDSEITK